jgi:AAA domain/Bifunctional DNA primase/polymerase, N-terminal
MLTNPFLPTSVYDHHRTPYDANGYAVHPIGPDSKVPMVFKDGEYVKMVAWQDQNRTMVTTPQPGAGIGVRLGRQRCGLYLVAMDWDDDKLSDVAMTRFPSPVAKVGQRGHTTFFVSRVDIAPKNYLLNGTCRLQVLGTGQQTVLPPTVHKDTKEPYWWLGDYTFANVKIENLPELPENHLELIDEIFREAGMTYDVEPEKPAPENSNGSGYDDSPYAQLNNDALRNLSAWVPDLNLYRCHRKVGRYPTYEAVATWRPSTTGRPNEERKLNLQISGGKGIMDFGTMQGYSPINLVMVALPCDRSTAIGWLQERLYPSTVSDAGLDKLVDALKEAPEPQDDAPKAEAEEPETDAPNEDELAKLLGPYWDYGDPLPEQIPMLIPHFVPTTGVGYLGGEWGTFKTFILNDMAVAVATRGLFAGQQVAECGCVIQLELEGSQNEVRVTGAGTARGIQGKPPIRVFTQLPPKILGANKRVTPEWKKWCRGMKVLADRMANDRGMPVRLFTIDPVNTVAGWTDEQSSAEGQAVYEGLLYLSQMLGCVVVAADHYGKAPGQGLRGTSVKETAALFILGTSKRDSDLAARRFLEIRKMKNGRQNIAMDFFMDEFSFTALRKVEKDGVETLEPMDVKTLAVRWDGELHPTEERRDSDAPTPQQHQMLIALKDLLRTKGAESQNGLVVTSKDWEEKCIADKICLSKGAFKNQKSAMKGKFIGVSESGDSVWIMMG